MKREGICRDQRGSSLVEAALVIPVLVFLLAGAYDLGTLYSAAIDVSAAAHAGAVYGVQSPTDTAGISHASLDVLGGVTTLIPTITHGCECPDGSFASVSCTTAPSCTANTVDYVEVSTQLIYTYPIPFPGLPKTVKLYGKSKMRTAY